MIGATLPGTEYSGAVFDLDNNRWVSRVCLGVGETSSNFEETVAFEKFVVPWMLAQEVGKIRVSSELPTFSARIDHRRISEENE
jgi:hypothetical protein